jgi:hypothetical protein
MAKSQLSAGYEVNRNVILEDVDVRVVQYVLLEGR